MEKNNKLLMARDVILAYMMKEDFTVDEAREVLHMCRNEIDASINRMNIKEVTIPQSPEVTASPTGEALKLRSRNIKRASHKEVTHPLVLFMGF